jgi:hypothetical protein
MRTVNKVWAAAKHAGAVYVDMYPASEGHDICSADPWIADYRGGLDKAHPAAPLRQLPPGGRRADRNGAGSMIS